jgi:hypothetical protein
MGTLTALLKETSAVTPTGPALQIMRDALAVVAHQIFLSTVSSNKPPCFRRLSINAFQGRLAPDVCRPDIIADADEHRMPKELVPCPLDERHLSDPTRRQPLEHYHVFGGDARAPPATPHAVREIRERTRLPPCVPKSPPHLRAEMRGPSVTRVSV